MAVRQVSIADGPVIITGYVILSGKNTTPPPPHLAMWENHSMLQPHVWCLLHISWDEFTLGMQCRSACVMLGLNQQTLYPNTQNKA